MCGIGQYQDDENGYGIEASNMLDAIHTSRIEAAPTKTAFSSRSTEKKRSYFARGNFDIMDRYLVMLAIRYDGYDKFFPKINMLLSRQYLLDGNYRMNHS